MDYSGMSTFRDGNLHNGFYRKSQEEQIDIDDCLSEIPFCECYIILQDAPEEECPYCSGENFLHGSCNLFAGELHKQFGYDVYEIVSKSGRDNHWFAETTYQGKKVYVDIRGITTSYDELISAFKWAVCEQSVPQKRKDSELLFHEDWSDTGKVFANAVIAEYAGYYDLVSDLR